PRTILLAPAAQHQPPRRESLTGCDSRRTTSSREDKSGRVAEAHPRVLREKYPCTAPSRRLAPAGTSGSRAIVLGIALAGKRESNSHLLRNRGGALPEVTRTFTTPESFVTGINGTSLFVPLLCPISYGGFRRQESNLLPSGYDVTRAFTTPQIQKCL